MDYSQDFVAQAKCKELALDQIAKGSQVVFQVAGGCGLGALSAAADEGVWGIGVDRDQSDPRPAHPHQRRQARGHLGLRHDQGRPGRHASRAARTLPSTSPTSGVALGKISPKVPQDIIDEIDALKQKIIDGEITPPTS